MPDAIFALSCTPLSNLRASSDGHALMLLLRCFDMSIVIACTHSPACLYSRFIRPISNYVLSPTPARLIRNGARLRRFHCRSFPGCLLRSLPNDSISLNSLLKIVLVASAPTSCCWSFVYTVADSTGTVHSFVSRLFSSIFLVG